MDWQQAKSAMKQGKRVAYRTSFGSHVEPWSTSVCEIKGPMGFGSDANLVLPNSSGGGILVPKNAEWKEVGE